VKRTENSSRSAHCQTTIITGERIRYSYHKLDARNGRETLKCTEAKFMPEQKQSSTSPSSGRDYLSKAKSFYLT